MSQVSFTWSISDPNEMGWKTVREQLAGTDLVNEYGPMPPRIIDSFIRARRDVVSRFMSRQDAMRIFNARPELLEIARQQRMPRYDD